MKICIVGLGLIGGSVALDLQNHKFASNITGVDKSKRNEREAIKLKIINEATDLITGVSNVDMVIIAIPVDAIRKLLPLILDNIKDHTTVIDLGSTKKSITDAVRNHPKRKNYIAAHPMAGTENSGPGAAIRGLFKGKTTIICDQELSNKRHLALAKRLIKALGSTITYTTSDKQDHSTAYISHLPHVAAYALANTVMDKESGDIIFELASGGFNSAARLAKSTPTMWGPIFTDNKKYILEGIDCYIKHLIELKNSIDNNEENMYMLMEKATEIRGVLNKKNCSLVNHE